MIKLFLALLIAFGINLTAQNEISYEFEFTGSKEELETHEPWLLYSDDIIEIDGYKYVSTLNFTDETFDIKKTDLKTGKIISTKKLSIKNLPKGYLYEDVIHLKNNKHYFKYSFWDKANKKEQLFIKEVDIVAGLFKGNEVLLLESDKIKNIAEFSVGYYSFSFKFPHFLSDDSTKIFFPYKKAPKEKNTAKNIDEITVSTFDDKMKLSNQQTYNMPKVEKYLKLLEYLTFDSNLLLLVEDSDPNAKSSLAYFNFNKNGNLDRFDIELKNVELKTRRIIKNNNALYLIGHGYEKENDLQDVTILTRLNSDLKMETKIQKFKTDFISNYRKNKRNDLSIDLDEIIFNEKDKTITLISEVVGQASRDSRSSMDNSVSTSFYPVFEDIIVSKFNLDFSHISDVKIPKNQYGQGTTSYEYIFLNNKYYFFYFNHLDNIEMSFTKEPKQYMTGGDGNFEVVTVDENNKVSKSILFKLSDLKVKAFVMSVINKNENGLSFDVMKEDKRAILKVKID